MKQLAITKIDVYEWEVNGDRRERTMSAIDDRISPKLMFAHTGATRSLKECFAFYVCSSSVNQCRYRPLKLYLDGAKKCEFKKVNDRGEKKLRSEKIVKVWR